MAGRLAVVALFVGMLVGLAWRGDSERDLQAWERVGRDCAESTSGTDAWGLRCLLATTSTSPVGLLRESDERLAADYVGHLASRAAREGDLHVAAAYAGWLRGRGYANHAASVDCALGGATGTAPSRCSWEATATRATSAVTSMSAPSTLSGATTAAGFADSPLVRGAGSAVDVASALHDGFRVTAPDVPAPPRPLVALGARNPCVLSSACAVDADGASLLLGFAVQQQRRRPARPASDPATLPGAP